MNLWIPMAVAMAATSAVDNLTPVNSEQQNSHANFPTVPVTTYRASGWVIHQTANFRICTRDTRADYHHLARRCEALRESLRHTWLGATSESAWTPRCDVIVHGSLTDYCRALGNGAGRSVGCASLQIDGERIVSRRIDLRVDAADWECDALPHELTHVVLADRFAGRHLPRWADEGMGVLAESTSKQEQRRTALKNAVRRRTVFTAADLLAITQFPPAAYHDAFYGQSSTLVRALVDRGSPAEFVEFLDRALRSGTASALKESYGIENVQHLHALLDGGVSNPAPIRTLGSITSDTRR